MRMRTWSRAALLAAFGAAMAVPVPSAGSARAGDLAALQGEWLYVEDVTEDRPSEEQQPPMSTIFALRVQKDAVVMERGKDREERIALDGSVTEVATAISIASHRGEWKDGVLEYQVRVVSVPDGALLSSIRREFRSTPDGLLVRVVVGDPAQTDSWALYRHPQDIPLPTPAPARIADLAWLEGAWTGTSGTSSIEERWSSPLGGSMLGISRTVAGGSMAAFEFLRIVERNGGLVYIAQPGGSPPTEFVLIDWAPTAAVFENPRHDSPQRIVYELTDERFLSASIGFIHGGRPQRFEYARESD